MANGDELAALQRAQRNNRQQGTTGSITRFQPREMIPRRELTGLIERRHWEHREKMPRAEFEVPREIERALPQDWSGRAEKIPRRELEAPATWEPITRREELIPEVEALVEERREGARVRSQAPAVPKAEAATEVAERTADTDKASAMRAGDRATQLNALVAKLRSGQVLTPEEKELLESVLGRSGAE